MSQHTEHLDANMTHAELGGTIDDPISIVLTCDDRVVIHGTRREVLDLIEDMLNAVDAESDTDSSASRQNWIDTGRFLTR